MTRARAYLGMVIAALLGIAGALLLAEWAADEPTPTHEELRT
jgi:hypothetical protein